MGKVLKKFYPFFKNTKYNITKYNIDMKITEKDLINLGFTKVHVSAEESGNISFNYFVFERDDTTLLITRESDDELENDKGYSIEFWEGSAIGKIDDLFTLQKLMEVIHHMNK